VILFPLLILAFIQGVLEFLPVSSEGQLLLVAINFLGFDVNSALSVAFWLHLGTAFAVVLFYRRDIFGPLYEYIRPLKAKEQQASLFGHLFIFVLIGTIGTAITALPLYFFLREFVTQLMGEVVSAFIGVLLLLTGIILYFQRQGKGTRLLSDISPLEALLLGLLQGIAVLPGISRSGITLTWLLMRGIEREEALRLSFLLGVPAALGLIGLDFLLMQFFIADPIILLIITIVAMLVGYLSLVALRYAAIQVPFWIFCLILGSIVIALAIPTLLSLTVLPP
jgi:undecaprenyl-diphosphatase